MIEFSQSEEILVKMCNAPYKRFLPLLHAIISMTETVQSCNAIIACYPLNDKNNFKWEKSRTTYEVLIAIETNIIESLKQQLFDVIAMFVVFF